MRDAEKEETIGDEPATEARRAIRLPRRVLGELRALEQGFRGDPERAVYRLIADSPETCDATTVGHDPTCKHPFVFVVVTDGRRILTFDRRGGEKGRRLRQPLTVGLRAPITPGGADPVLEAMQGALESRLRFARRPIISYRGVVNDELDDAARSNLGLVFLVHVTPGSAMLSEGSVDPEITELRRPVDELTTTETGGARPVDTPAGGWVRMERLRRMGSSLESWSHLLLPEIGRWVDDGSIAA